MKEGWSDGGYSITGVHYYHLNFKKINMLDHNQQPCFEHPYFAFEDQQLFRDCDYAKSKGRGILLITGRGFGKSYDVTSLIEHRFVLYPASECIVSASTDFFATNMWNKIDVGLNSLPDDLRPTMLVDKTDLKESGMEIIENGKKKKVGFRSKIWKVVYDNDEGRTRGTRPDIHAFEEIGSWTGKAKLIDCYKATEPSWKRGSYFTCFPILIGTGGQMKSGGSKDAEKMFWNPEAFGLMSFEYPGQDWYDPAKKPAKFFACFEKFEGYYEKTGISNKTGAKMWHDKERDRKKSDLSMFLQHTMEFPYNPYEAFRVDGTGLFDRAKLEGRHMEISQSEVLKNIVQRGRLDFINKHNPMMGVKWVQDKNGPIEIVEHPEWVVDSTLNGQKIPFLYISGCDSYDAVEEEGDAASDKSRGSIFVFKRFWTPEKTGKIFVAKCTIRERDATAFYWETVKLNMYYNSKMLYEHTKIGIAQHYITNKLHRFLHERPKLEEVGVVKKTVSTNRYGLVMPDQVKVHCIKRYAKYIDDYVENMYFLTQIEDALKFHFGSSSHDETMAASICIVHDDDLHNVEIRERKKEVMKFPTFTTVNGRTHFG